MSANVFSLVHQSDLTFARQLPINLHGQVGVIIMHMEPVCVQMLVQTSTGLIRYRYTGHLFSVFILYNNN